MPLRLILPTAGQPNFFSDILDETKSSRQANA